MTDLVEQHRLACAEFSRTAGLAQPDHWEHPTPCSEWDARALVEHVIGFHDFLLLRPMGVRAKRPRTDPVARWEATRTAIFVALDAPGALDQATDLPGGGQSTPRTMLEALTTEMLVHTWDLAVATDQQPTTEVLEAALAYGRDPDWRRERSTESPGIIAPSPTRADRHRARRPRRSR